MNNIEEIKHQTQFDCFGAMYACLAIELVKWGGVNGERALREGVRSYGEEKGWLLRERHTRDGTAVNLHSLIRQQRCCGEDPRFHLDVKQDTGQVQTWEVYSCPLQRIWSQYDCEKEGGYYCEELVHAVVKAYTQGKGQANLSNRKTCERDDFCLFALYYRPSNVSGLQKNQSFGRIGLESEVEKEPLKGGGEFRGMKKDFLGLYRAILGAAQDCMGMEGVAAVTAGLGKLTKETAGLLISIADRTGNRLDVEFMEQYFPLALDAENMKNTIGRNDQYMEMIVLNFIQPLLTKLNISVTSVLGGETEE